MLDTLWRFLAAPHARPKPNPAERPERYAVRFPLRLDTTVEYRLANLMEDRGLPAERRFPLGDLEDSALIDLIVHHAVQAMEGERLDDWQEFLFDDGSAINDPSLVEMIVHSIRSPMSGLGGMQVNYDVTIYFPEGSRYLPED